MLYKIRNWIFKHFKDNFTAYFTMCILLVVGIVVGAITIKVLNVEEKNQILSFFNSFFKLLNKEDMNSSLLLKESLIGNMKTILIIWLTGVVIIGIPVIPIIVLLRGFAMGFTVGFLVNEFGLKGFLFSIFALLPQNIFIVPGIISISSIGISYSLNRVKGRKNRVLYKYSLTSFLNYSSIIFLFCILIVVGSLVEAYISPLFMKFIVDYVN
ncbi:stage II sporulation protein M [Anaerosalibacter sp. Marseille-P3206]|uniref:stage II sporulation protein M n=1 Tax=Anaerosalibacter sp. Marseille-P3206 TaxID=1871005 RepID=UPI000985F799|nr:stage II sporulation protein M [Anaerosalibacter sp. Marseille-P3206]